MKCLGCGKNFYRNVEGFNNQYNYLRKYHKKCYLEHISKAIYIDTNEQEGYEPPICLLDYE